MPKYWYKGMTYYRLRMKYKKFELDYKMYRKNNQWHAVLENNETEEEIVFLDPNRKHCQKKIQAWFYDLVENQIVLRLIEEKYKIYPFFEDILVDIRETNVAYHVTEKKHLESILKEGLIPQTFSDQDVLSASQVLDQIKPSSILEWVKREGAIYAYPKMTNDLLGSGRKDCVLLAIQPIPTKSWVGSQGIGGLCLFDREMDEESTISHTQKIIQSYGKLYWRYSCSLDEYKKKPFRIEKKDRKVGLDEILIFETIPPLSIEWIGEWNAEEKFYPNEWFSNYVKEKFKPNFQEILRYYK